MTQKYEKIVEDDKSYLVFGTVGLIYSIFFLMVDETIWNMWISGFLAGMVLMVIGKYFETREIYYQKIEKGGRQ